MSPRERLPSRRYSETLDIEVDRLRYTATLGFYPDGRLGEIFLTSSKAGSMAGINANDAAVVASIALQYGAPLDVIRKALMRDPRGGPSGPLAAALDQVAEAVDPARGVKSE